MNTKYRMVHNNWDPHLTFPLVVAKFKQDTIYVDPMWGVRIEKLTVDGRGISGEAFNVKLDDVNFNKIPIGDDPFVYQVRRSYLVFAKTLDGMKYQLEKYTIPEAAKRIVIEYRLRESNDSVGPVFTLESTLT
jgi:hypothetical protein